EIFVLDVPTDLSAQNSAEQIAGVMFRTLLRDLDYTEDYEIAELEGELEKEGKLAAFQDLCRAEYQEEWHEIRRGDQKFACCSNLLHQLDAGPFVEADTGLRVANGGPL